MSEYIPKKRRTLADTLRETSPVPVEMMREIAANMDRIASRSERGAPKKEHQGAQNVVHLSEEVPLGAPEAEHHLPLDRLERWRRFYLSDKPEEMDTWPNLVGFGLTEEMLLEDIDIRELKGVPASIFDEDMAILNYNVGQPEWVKRKIKSSPLRYLRACIAQGDVTPAEGYESPVTARLKALRARREARELELRVLERKG